MGGASFGLDGYGSPHLTPKQHGLPDDIPFEMPNTGGVTVTPLTANHCLCHPFRPCLILLLICQVLDPRCSSLKGDRLSMLVTRPSRVLMWAASGYSGTYIAVISERERAIVQGGDEAKADPSEIPKWSFIRQWREHASILAISIPPT